MYILAETVRFLQISTHARRHPEQLRWCIIYHVTLKRVSVRPPIYHTQCEKPNRGEIKSRVVINIHHRPEHVQGFCVACKLLSIAIYLEMVCISLRSFRIISNSKINHTLWLLYITQHAKMVYVIFWLRDMITSYRVCKSNLILVAGRLGKNFVT